jgi:very-short-patch-repair endonuclease
MDAKPTRYRPKLKVWEKTRVAARAMRRAPTEAEALLWNHLRNRHLAGFRFRRQHPIDRFVVDFCCPAVRLVVEVDGGIHKGMQEQDRARERFLRELGFDVVRFSNEAVLRETDRVLSDIRLALQRSDSSA